MRLSTLAFSFMALGLTSVAAISIQQDTAPAVRDFERKMQVRDPRKHSKRRSEQLITNGMLSEYIESASVESNGLLFWPFALFLLSAWYGGSQLDNPACGGSTPTSSSKVVAVKEGGMFKCGDKVHIHYNDKMVAATVVDYCSGCSAHHIDATEGVFKELASLSVGVLTDLHIKLIPSWTRSMQDRGIGEQRQDG
jgi:hypothetical protein